MKNKLILSLAVAGLAASMGAYATAPTGAAPFQVIVPDKEAGLGISGAALYLQPTSSGLSFLTAYDDNNSTASVVSDSNSIVNPNYAFGFNVGLSYVFPNSGNDMQINWTHFNQSTSRAVGLVASSTQYAITSLGFDSKEFDSLSGTGTASSDVSFKYDSIDLDMGQYIAMGTRFEARLFAGLRYAQIKNDISNIYTGQDTGSLTDVETLDSKFTGIGPRIGVDTTYHLYNCLGVVTHFATSLLVGRTETSGNAYIAYTDTEGVAYSESYAVSEANQTRVVPAIDAKLGFDYTFKYNNNAKSYFDVEAGYQVTQYIDAIDRLNGNYYGGSSSASVGFNGPYLSLSVKI